MWDTTSTWRRLRSTFLPRCWRWLDLKTWTPHSTASSSPAALRLAQGGAASYRELAADDPRLTSLPPMGAVKIKPVNPMRAPPPWRRLLIAVGDLPSTSIAAPTSILDAELVEGLRRFQSRHGLDDDGVLGRASFQALTTPFEQRARQIELTMERIRWLPAFDTPPIIVNIPQFRLFAFRTVHDFADQILQMDVIVGSAFKGRHTPVFSAVMRSVVIRPYWDVPRSILVKELLPDIRANRALARRERLRDRAKARVMIHRCCPRRRRTSGCSSKGAFGFVSGRRQPMRWVASSSCSPTVTTSTCTTRPRGRCSSAAGARSVTGASACRIRWRCSLTSCGSSPGWSDAQRDAAWRARRRRGFRSRAPSGSSSCMERRWRRRMASCSSSMICMGSMRRCTEN